MIDIHLPPYAAAEMGDDPHYTQCRCRPCQVERSGLTEAEIWGAG